MTSTPALTRAAARSRSPGRVPIAAPTSSCLFASLDAEGKSRFFFRSVREVRAMSSCLSLTMGSLPFLDSRMMRFACKNVRTLLPSGARRVPSRPRPHLLERDALDADNDLRRHDLADGRVGVLAEVVVTVRHYAEQA